MNVQRVVTLMYHRIGQANNEWERKYCVSPRLFAAQMGTLASQGMSAIAIDDFVAWLAGNRELPANSFLITFDDGFRGIRDHALPVLDQYHWPATVFLVSGLIGKRDEWTQPLNPDGATYPLLDANDIRDMAKWGVSFHSHTRTHPSLPTLDAAQLEDELIGCRTELEDLLGKPVDYLAYPFGHYDERVLNTCRQAGYKAAFSVQPGFNLQGADPFRVRRLDVFGTDSPAMLRRKVHFGTNDGSLRHTVRYYGERMLSHLGIVSDG